MTDFDVFVVGEAMLKTPRLNMTTIRSAFSYGMSGRYGYGNLLQRYCNKTGRNQKEIELALTSMMLKIKQLQRHEVANAIPKS